MNMALSTTDWLFLAPLILLLIGGLLQLIMQTFFEEKASRLCFWIFIGTLFVAAFSEFTSSESSQSLIDRWFIQDRFSRLFSLFFLGAGFFTALLTPSFFKIYPRSEGEYYFFLTSAIFGLFLIGGTADFLTLFLGIETLSLSLYLLCGYAKKWPLSNEASLKYFLIGAIGAAFLVYGIALIYGALGTLRFDLVAEKALHLSSETDKNLFLAGIALLTAGLAFKASLVPFQVFAPDAYSGAPTPIAAFMSAATKAGAFAAFARLFLFVFPKFEVWDDLASILIYATLIFANFVALRQTQLRRFFAYSSISHAGFLLIPVVAGTEDALPALFFYLTIYAFGTFGAFSVASFFDKDQEGAKIEDLKGLFYSSPGLALVMIFSLLGLAGIPPLSGFFAKLYLFKTAFASKHYGLVIVGLLTAILAAAYYLRIINMLFSRQECSIFLKKNTPAMVAGALAIAGLVFFSFFPNVLFDFVSSSTPV